MYEKITNAELEEAGAIKKVVHIELDDVNGDVLIFNVLPDVSSEEVGIFVWKQDEMLNVLKETIQVDEKGIGFGHSVDVYGGMKMIAVGCGPNHNKIYLFDAMLERRRNFILEIPERAIKSSGKVINNHGKKVVITGSGNIVEVTDEHNTKHFFRRSNRYFDWRYSGSVNNCQ